MKSVKFLLKIISKDILRYIVKNCSFQTIPSDGVPDLYNIIKNIKIGMLILHERKFFFKKFEMRLWIGGLL